MPGGSSAPVLVFKSLQKYYYFCIIYICYNMEVSAEVIAQHFNGEIIGDPTVKVSSVAKIESGKPGNICFLANPKYSVVLLTYLPAGTNDNKNNIAIMQ